MDKTIYNDAGEKVGKVEDLIISWDFLRTSNARIFAAGDVCLAQQYTNTAQASARIVVRNALLMGRQCMSALTIPWCTYADPEVAHVGMYVKEARQRRIPVKTFTIPRRLSWGGDTSGDALGSFTRRALYCDLIASPSPSPGDARHQARLPPLERD